VAQSVEVYLFEMSTDKANDVFIRVFLSSEMRTRFKVACAKNEVAMSEKARELIEEWTISQETQSQNSSQSEDKGDK
jgi:Tfp pilus assembly ATPase PilU